jgi:hypothetical protein
MDGDVMMVFASRGGENRVGVREIGCRKPS